MNEHSTARELEVRKKILDELDKKLACCHDMMYHTINMKKAIQDEVRILEARGRLSEEEIERTRRLRKELIGK